MIENFRTGLIWNTMQRKPCIRLGLQRAGFSGGWLEQAMQSWWRNPARQKALNR
jgi:hypothetical protein